MLVSTMDVSLLCYLIKMNSAKVLRCQGVEVLRCQVVGFNNGCVCIILFDQDKNPPQVSVVVCMLKNLHFLH